MEESGRREERNRGTGLGKMSVEARELVIKMTPEMKGRGNPVRECLKGIMRERERGVGGHDFINYKCLFPNIHSQHFMIPNSSDIYVDLKRHAVNKVDKRTVKKENKNKYTRERRKGGEEHQNNRWTLWMK